MTLDEIITKCNIGEDHLTQEEYEQVGRWLEDYKVYKKALELACNDIADSHPILKSLGFDYYEEHYLKKAREEE